MSDSRINYQLAMWEAKRQEGQRWQARAARWDVNERRVFISYSGGDKLIADDVRRRLQARKIPSFAFDHDMVPGDEIVARIKAEIDRSSHIVVVATRESMKTPYWLSYELALGDANQKALLTLVPDLGLDLPDPFRRYRYVRGWDEFERYFDQPEFDPAVVEDFLTEVLQQPAHERARYRPVAGAVATWECGEPRNGGHLTLEALEESPCLTVRDWSAGQMNWEYMLVHDAALRALVIRPVMGFFRGGSLGGGTARRDLGIVIEYEPASASAKTRGWRTSNAFWLATVRLLVEELARATPAGAVVRGDDINT
ncbi:toll/interleukin-1 receptor domain-containing protein [Reyranella sp.]|uniref:toll/interleukin-1 receptor domain-containing protein n=1 Tax=Reyranella sp. TaxID=1929291 RepID=UPI003D0F1AA1